MNTHHVTEYYEKIRNKRYALKSLLINNDYNILSCTVEMVFISLADSTDLFRLIFTGVSSLKIHSAGSWPKSLVLSIEDVRARQWENISFDVRDIEEEVLSFFCKDLYCIPLAELPPET